MLGHDNLRPLWHASNTRWPAVAAQMCAIGYVINKLYPKNLLSLKRSFKNPFIVLLESIPSVVQGNWNVTTIMMLPYDQLSLCYSIKSCCKVPFMQNKVYAYSWLFN